MKQYYHRHIQLPQPGDIREIADKRTGKVLKLGRVTRINSQSRTAEIELLDLDRQGRERTK